MEILIVSMGLMKRTVLVKSDIVLVRVLSALLENAIAEMDLNSIHVCFNHKLFMLYFFQAGETSACYPQYSSLCTESYCSKTGEKCEIKSNTQTCLSKSFCGAEIQHNHLLPNNLEYRLVDSFHGTTGTCSSHVEINSKVFNITDQERAF